MFTALSLLRLSQLIISAAAAYAADAAVLEAALLTLLELVKDESGRELLSGNELLKARLEAMASESQVPAGARETACALLKDIRRPPLASASSSGS